MSSAHLENRASHLFKKNMLPDGASTYFVDHRGTSEEALFAPLGKQQQCIADFDRCVKEMPHFKPQSVSAYNLVTDYVPLTNALRELNRTSKGYIDSWLYGAQLLSWPIGPHQQTCLTAFYRMPSYHPTTPSPPTKMLTYSRPCSRTAPPNATAHSPRPKQVYQRCALVSFTTQADARLPSSKSCPSTRSTRCRLLPRASHR